MVAAERKVEWNPQPQVARDDAGSNGLQLDIPGGERDESSRLNCITPAKLVTQPYNL